MRQVVPVKGRIRTAGRRWKAAKRESCSGARALLYLPGEADRAVDLAEGEAAPRRCLVPTAIALGDGNVGDRPAEQIDGAKPKLGPTDAGGDKRELISHGEP